MGKLKLKNQSGFGTVEIILVIIIIALLGAVGWFVYDRSQNKTTTSTAPAAAETQATSAPKPDTKTYLVIKEWGIKVPTTDKTKTASYEIPSGYPNQVNLIVKVDGANGDECSQQAQIYRYNLATLKTDPQGLPEIPTETSLKDSASAVKGVYYKIVGSQSACSSDTTVQTKATTIRTDFLAQNLNIVAN